MQAEDDRGRQHILYTRFNSLSKVCKGCKLAVNSASHLGPTLVEDGSESRGSAGVAGLPGQRQPVEPMYTPRFGTVRTSAAASTNSEGGLALRRRTISRTRPACRRPRRACFPCSRCPELTVAPVAWTWSVICTLQQGFRKDLWQILITDCGYYWGFSADWAHVFALLFRVVCC